MVRTEDLLRGLGQLSSNGEDHVAHLQPGRKRRRVGASKCEGCDRSYDRNAEYNEGCKHAGIKK